MKWFAISTHKQDDVKSWLALDTRLRGRWLELYLLAARIEPEGIFCQNGTALSIDDIAILLRADPDELKADMARFKELGIIHENGRGFEFPNFQEEQRMYYEKNRKAPDAAANRRQPPETGLTPYHTIPEDNTPHQTTSGGQAVLQPDREEILDAAEKILIASTLSQSKVVTLLGGLATRISRENTIRDILATFAYCYSQPNIKSPVALAGSLLLKGELHAEYFDRSTWKAIPENILQAANIDPASLVSQKTSESLQKTRALLEKKEQVKAVPPPAEVLQKIGALTKGKAVK